MSSSVATGLSFGQPGRINHAEKAIRQAMEKLATEQANAVLLFLSADQAQNPAPIIRSVARIAGCTQVFGCIGTGLITEDEWVLDASGAAVMAFTDPIHCLPADIRKPERLKICFCKPADVDMQWLLQSANRFGAIAADNLGTGPFAVWQAAGVLPEQPSMVEIQGVHQEILTARGLRILSQPQCINETRGYEILQLSNKPALEQMLQVLPGNTGEEFPSHMLMCGVTYGNTENAIEDERYHLNHILQTDSSNHSVTLSEMLQPGDHVFWAVRDHLAAEFDLQFAIYEAKENLGGPPEFAILLPCISRGPSFYDGKDRDLEILRQHFPDLLIIGIYNNGQLTPGSKKTRLNLYSTVAGLFALNS